MDAIDAEKADLVAVGFRGTSGILEDFVLGSVSRAIVHSAKIPALVVKSEGRTEEPAKQSPGPATREMHVLVTCDPSQPAQPLADLLKQFTWPPESRGWVMTVVQPMFMTQLAGLGKAAARSGCRGDGERLGAGTSAELAGWLASSWRSFARRCRRASSSKRSSLPRGGRRKQILAQIRERAIDLAVLGSRGRGSFKRLLLGSTSEQVLREAPCSVLIVR